MNEDKIATEFNRIFKNPKRLKKAMVKSIQEQNELTRKCTNMNELKEQIRKLLVDNGCRLDNDSAVSRTVDLLATYTAKKELEARIDERLDIRERLNNIHYKYPNDDANSDRLFRNDFMSIFSEYMDETIKIINQLQSQLTNNKEKQ